MVNLEDKKERKGKIKRKRKKEELTALYSQINYT